MNIKITTLILTFISLSFTGFSQETNVIGVTEPLHEIDLAFPESGIISEIAVAEGQSVKKGDLLIKLDLRIQQARKKKAQIKANSMAAVRAAYAEMNMRERRLDQVKQLGARNSNPDEMAKAEVDFEMAKARYEAADEDVQTAKIELQQIETEIERRMLRSPIDGIVARIYRDVAESVVGGETVVASIVNLDQLKLVVHVPAEVARGFRAGAVMNVNSANPKIEAGVSEAEIVFVSPVVNASSGTKMVRLQINNKDRQHESGVKYGVSFRSEEPERTLVTQK